MLEDAVRTAGGKDQPVISSVLLSTDRTEVEVSEDESPTEALIDVVESDVLVASSTNGTMVGQGHTWCTGTLHRSVLLSLIDVKAVIAVFGDLVTGRLGKGQTHRTRIELSGDTVAFSEDPEQVHDNTVISLNALPLDDYPTNLPAMLQPDPTIPQRNPTTNAVVEPSYGTGFAAEHLAIVVAVSKRKKMPIAVYRYHQQGRLLVTVGSYWRCVFLPTKLDDEAGQYEDAQVPVFMPRLPAKAETPPLVA